MHRASVLLAVLALATAADPPAPPITVAAAALHEEGVLVFGDGGTTSGSAKLRLAITIAGSGGATPLEVGRPRVDLIVLDDGRRIERPPGGGGQREWTSGGGGLYGNRPSTLRSAMVLPAAVRGAKAIATLSGVIPCTWATGIKRARLAPLRDHLGKRIRIAGVTGEPVLALSRHGDEVQLVLDDSVGPLVSRVQFVDAAGGELTVQRSGMSGDGTTQTLSFAVANQPDDLGLQIDFWTGMQAADVPFTLADVHLFEPPARAGDGF